MFEIEFTAKNPQKAIALGLKELGLKQDDVDIKILETGGFLKKAKVLLSVPNENLNKNEKIKSIVALKKIQENKSINNNHEQPLNANQNNSNSIQKDDYSLENQPKSLCPQNAPIKNNTKKSNSGKEGLDINFLDNSNSNDNYKNKENNEKTNKKLSSFENNSATNKKLNGKINNEEQIEKLQNFLSGFINIANLKIDVSTRENDDEIFIDLIGEDCNKLIGEHGETINALQYILSVFNNHISRHSKKIRLDVDSFRQKRKQTIESLANRMAKKVLETGKSIKLEPMSAYERRLVHKIVYKFKDLESHSYGKEPKRFLVIQKKDI